MSVNVSASVTASVSVGGRAVDPGASDSGIAALFAAQYAASRADQYVALDVRMQRIDRAIAMMTAHSERLCAAMSADFGNRPPAVSIAIDIAATVDSLRAARRNLRKWMRPQRRNANFPMGWLGVRTEVRMRPLGVVCIVGAWNFPVGTVTAPLAGVLAAGNRAILKPSELAPMTCQALATAVAEYFTPEEVAVVIGDAGLGRALTALPFDRIVFTGGGGTARHIMRAAADHLTPLTLELGGKSPVIVSRSADLAQAARQIMFGKLFNAGQVCVGPDYVLAPVELRDALVAELAAAAAAMFPRFHDNPDYTGIATDAHRRHLQAMLADATAKGAHAIVINPANEASQPPGSTRLLPHILLNVTSEMAVMQQEIFGPILPVRGYQCIGDAIAEVNAGPRPLALYYFGHDAAEEALVTRSTISGGVTINDIMLHAATEDLPFGGVGASGFGQYRGQDGFREFSCAQSVARQSRFNLVWRVLCPPYTPFKLGALRALLR